MIKKLYIKNTINILLMFIVLFFILEFCFRVFLSAISGNILAFNYGLNDNIEIQVFDLSDLKIRVVNNNLINDKTPKTELKTVSGEKKELWAFGGSTTAGYNCSNQSSSWPEELEKIESHSIKVINFGRDGTNSDFAYIELLAALQNNRPDWVLWANRANETDPIYGGFKRNKDKIISTDIKVKNINNIKLNIHRAAKTFENYSVFYYIFMDFYKRVIWKLKYNKFINYQLPIKNIEYEEYTEYELNLAAKNFEINIKDILALSNIYKFKIAIVTLVQRAELDNMTKHDYIMWSNVYLKKVKELASLKNIYWINTIEWNYNLKNMEKTKVSLFCDGLHQTLEGNKQVSQAIYEKLKNDLNLFKN